MSYRVVETAPNNFPPQWQGDVITCERLHNIVYPKGQELPDVCPRCKMEDAKAAEARRNGKSKRRR